MLNKSVAVFAILFCTTVTVHAQQVISLYRGAAPGSEEWTHEEKEFFSNIFRTEVVTNVVHPTIAVYKPGNANGTSVIVCPGGGFHALSINSEGVDGADWLNEQGITAFVLKYRLVPTGEDGVKDMLQKNSKPEQLKKDMRMILPLAVADGAAAIEYVRSHADELGVKSNRIGIMGFSAGGTVAVALALENSPETRPDFVAPIYAYLGDMDGLGSKDVPKNAPPMFLTAATNDQLGLATHSVSLYSKWIAAKKPAELHLYAKGGHGFGMKTQNLPTDRWIDRFGEWLVVQNLVSKAKS